MTNQSFHRSERKNDLYCQFCIQILYSLKIKRLEKKQNGVKSHYAKRYVYIIQINETRQKKHQTEHQRIQFACIFPFFVRFTRCRWRFVHLISLLLLFVYGEVFFIFCLFSSRRILSLHVVDLSSLYVFFLPLHPFVCHSSQMNENNHISSIV